MKYTSQHCCDKTVDDKMALYPVLFSELYKIMVNKVTFAYFRGGNRPPPSGPWLVIKLFVPL